MSCLQDVQRRLRTEDQYLHYLFRLRFPRPTCPRCGRTGAYYRHPAKQCYTCACGRSHIYPRKGTIFEHSSVPLSQWFKAVFLLTAFPRDVSVKELEQCLGVTYVTAWRMAKKIRTALRHNQVGESNAAFFSLIQQCMRGSETLVSPVRKSNIRL